MYCVGLLQVLGLLLCKPPCRLMVLNSKSLKQGIRVRGVVCELVEVVLRHAPCGCVLMGGKWSPGTLDLCQLRTLQAPLFHKGIKKVAIA